MVKPNDTIAIIIALHIVVLALVAWLLFRFIRVFPADYSVTSTTSSSASTDPGPKARPPAFSPFGPGARVNVSGATRVHYSGPGGPGGRVNVGGGGRGGGRGPGGRIHVVDAQPGPGAHVNAA